MPNNFIIALVIFVIASFTDFLDGYLARSMNLVTKLGKFLDPLADKLLVISAMVAFVEIGLLSSVVVLIIISRELIISVFRAIAASEGIVIAASWWGKLKTNSQILMIVILLLNDIKRYSKYVYNRINLWVLQGDPKRKVPPKIVARLSQVPSRESVEIAIIHSKRTID